MFQKRTCSYSFPSRRLAQRGRQGKAEVLGSCRPAWQVQQRTVLWVGTSCSSLLLVQRGMSGEVSSRAQQHCGVHSAITLGTKRTLALLSIGSTEAGQKMPPEHLPFESVAQVSSAHPQEAFSSLSVALLIFWFKKKSNSYVIFNGTSACAWRNLVQTNRSIITWDCSLKKHIWARFLTACNFALLFKRHNVHSQSGQSLGHNCQTNNCLDIQFHYRGNYISPNVKIFLHHWTVQPPVSFSMTEISHIYKINFKK